MKIKTFVAAIFMLVMVHTHPYPSCGGEFGLIISDTAPFPCKANVSYPLNTCTSDAVETELRAYFVEGKSPKIEAVKYFLDRCSVHPAGQKENEKLRTLLMALLTDRSVSNTKDLYLLISCFPYKSMRSAIDNELKKEYPETIRNRLIRARDYTTAK
jgi:hypothetical protein